MKEILNRIFFVNWPRKLIAFVSALVIWFLVNQSITVTKTYPNIPVKVINLAPHKTLANQNKKITITLKGDNRTIEELNASDLEIVINAEEKEESFIAKIDKKNLNLVNRDEPYKDNIYEVTSDPLFIKISNLITEEIPLTINFPLGDPPPGFQYLDVAPKQLVQKVTGPEEEVEALKKKGLELTFDLDKISREELEAIKSLQPSAKNDELSFFIPTSWKKVAIPFSLSEEPLTDPRAQYLRIEFLTQDLLGIDFELPLTLFFPVNHSDTLNPDTVHFQTSPSIEKRNGLYLLNERLYAQGVSRRFLDIVQNNITITVVVEPKKNLSWSILFIDEKSLEEAFLASFSSEKEMSKYTEEGLRNRFRNYLDNLELYLQKGMPLTLLPVLKNNEVILK